MKVVKTFLGLFFIVIFFSLNSKGLVVEPNEQSSKVPSFKDFIVSDIFKGKPAAINFASDPSAKRFWTRLTEGAKKGPNFAGHYTVITWGCGVECHTTAIVDAKNGNVYFAPFITSWGCEYTKNSYLLIANPLDDEDTKEIYDSESPKWLNTDYYVWKDNKFSLIYTSKKEKATN